MNPAEEALLDRYVAGLSTVASHTGSETFWEEWSKFIQKYKNNGLVIRELDPRFYIGKLQELSGEVFGPHANK